jgi:hypothetical protein
MIRQLSDFIVGTSRSFPRFLLAAALGPATLFLVLFPIMRGFAALSGGLQPFDWQNELTAAEVIEQLPAYTEPMRQLYYAHAFIDYVFPIFVAAFFGAIAAFALRHGVPRLYDRAARLGIFALYFVSVPFDYCENTGSLAAILFYPSPPGPWADLILFGKSVKLTTEFLIPGATALALVVAAGGWVLARLRKSNA